MSTQVEPAGAGTVDIRPPSSDGFYTLGSPIEISATPTSGSAFRFLRWAVQGDHWWSWYWIHMHGEASNPARTRVGPGLVYRASFVEGPILRIDSNVDPVPLTADGRERRTPLAFRAGQFSGRTTLIPRLIESWGRAYRHRFRSWSDGGDLTHTVDVPRDVDTTLALTLDTEYRITTRAWQDWYGNRILTTPPSADGFYPDGAQVRLLASARPPAKFIGWNGDVSGRGRATAVVMDDGKLAEAVFALDAAESTRRRPRPAARLRPGVPAAVSLRWNGRDRDFERYYVRPPRRRANWRSSS